jgi:lipopolysaccharide biosynthesis glycosyltransferase
MKDNTIPIVFSANNYYVPYMATTMQSIMENANQNMQYVFYVLHQEITNNNMNLLRNQISLFPQFSIEFIDVGEHISKYNLYISRHITIEAYFRLFIPELLSEYQKAIYLDGDMIVCTDIAELFDIDLNSYLLAAVRDTGVSWYYTPKHSRDTKIRFSVLLRLKNHDEYFNSGMLVLNIELFRETISTDKLLELASSREWQIHDQDVLNSLAYGKTLLLNFHWNAMATDNWAKYLPAHLKQEYDEAQTNPKIIHYKPWDYDYYIPHFELFWKYATRTPFINVILERMKSKDSINNKTLKERIVSNIKHRRGIGIRFILFDCIRAWLFSDKR